MTHALTTLLAIPAVDHDVEFNELAARLYNAQITGAPSGTVAALKSQVACYYDVRPLLADPRRRFMPGAA